MIQLSIWVRERVNIRASDRQQGSIWVRGARHQVIIHIAVVWMEVYINQANGPNPIIFS